MTNYTILVPIDFSEASENAVKFAAQLGKRLQGNILLFHANPVPDADPFKPAYAYRKTGNVEMKYQEAISDKMDELQQLVNRETEGKTTVEYMTDVGNPVVDVLNISKEENIKLIVMGMASRKEDKDYYAINNILSIIEEADAPVLVVPKTFAFHEISNILYASDEDEKNEESLRDLIEIAERVRAKITVVHVSDPGDEEDKEKQMQMMEKIRRNFTYGDMDFINIEHEDVVEGIKDYLEKNSVDLLSMRKHKRNFIENIFQKSLTMKMAKITSIPMLVFHEK